MNGPTSPLAHPEDLLADYVDGRLDQAARVQVELHLEGCDRCRQEVEASRRAVAMLAQLPELEGIGLADRIAAGAIPGFQTTPSGSRGAQDVTYLESRRRARARAVAGKLIGAAAAAAVILAGVLLVPRLGGGGGAGGGAISAGSPNRAAASEAAPPAATPPPSLPPVVNAQATYSRAQLDQLAVRFAAAAGKGGQGPEQPVSPPEALGGSAVPSPARSLAADTARSASVADCLRSGAGLADSAVPIYLEAAEVDGVQAYVGAFRLPGADLDFTLVAVAREGCSFLYSVSRRAG